MKGKKGVLMWTLIIVVLGVGATTAGLPKVEGLSESSSLTAYFCLVDCPGCTNQLGYKVSLNSCGLGGSYQGKNFSSFLITNATAEANSFSVVFFDHPNCSATNEIVRTPACSFATCCPLNFTLATNVFFQSYTVLTAPSPSPSPSPSPRAEGGGDEKLPLWTIIVMAVLGGAVAVLLVTVVILLAVLVCGKGKGRGPHYRPLPTN